MTASAPAPRLPIDRLTVLPPIEPTMPAAARPLSPHLSIYRWQIQMVTSILHRATGIALGVGSLCVCLGLLALAAGPAAFDRFRAFSGSWLGVLLLFGWSWALAFHFCNGIRHLLQDAGLGFAPSAFIRNGWLAVAGSVVVTVFVWIVVLGARSDA